MISGAPQRPAPMSIYPQIITHLGKVSFADIAEDGMFFCDITHLHNVVGIISGERYNAVVAAV